MNELLAAIEQRRQEGEFTCDSCNATGLYEGSVCGDCLGQGCLLTQEEYDYLVSLNDSILDAEIID